MINDCVFEVVLLVSLVLRPETFSSFNSTLLGQDWHRIPLLRRTSLTHRLHVLYLSADDIIILANVL